MIEVNDVYSIIKGNDNPLSCDIAIIKGKKYNYIFEAGNGEYIINELNEIDNKIIMVSHFHQDHLANLNKLTYSKLYIGEHTNKYTKTGEIVKDISIEDGIKLRIFELSNSHCKGSICLVVGDYCFAGDAIAPSNVKGQYVYNVQKLKEEIDVLSGLDVKYIVSSHHMDEPYLKQDVLARLSSIYAKREKNNPYITIEE